MSTVPATDLEPLGAGHHPVRQRAQALRLVRHLFKDIDPALATAIASWVVGGSLSGVREVLSDLTEVDR